MISALIPARGGSKGIPKKNILNIFGYPLIAYSISVCKKCKDIDKVYVSTDDEEISAISEFYGATVLRRPSELAMDLSNDYGVVKHFFDCFPCEEVSYIRPTTPARNVETLSSCISFYKNNKYKLTGVRSVHELSESPYKFIKIEDSGYCGGFFESFNGIKQYTNLPRQMFPKAYHPNGYIDILKKETIEKGSDFGDKILPFLTRRVCELDIEEDIEFVKNDLERNVTFDIFES